MQHHAKENSRELLIQLLDNITDNIYFKDVESRFILINKAFGNRLGMNPDDVVGKTDFDIFTEEHARPAFETEQQIIKTGEPILGIEEKETWENGHTTWASTTKMPLRNAEGEIIGTFGMSRDITEHKLNEIQLHKYARRLSAINKQMEEDLQMAANLQQAFLPQSYPLFIRPDGGHQAEFSHRYIASTQVSGDLCSIHKLSETDVGLLICDVMGHGVRSALITAIVHTMIGELTQRKLSPGEFFSEMNRQLRPIFQSQEAFIFVTASYLVLNTETGILTGASAGHPAPFLVQSNVTPRASLLHAADRVCGPALAVVKHFEYKSFEHQMQPGDSVVMCTDGILEEVNADNEEFGADRIISVLSEQPDNIPDLACDSLVDAVNRFHGAERLNDDICLLSFRWNPA